MKLQFGFEDIPYSARYSKQSPLTATQKRRAAKKFTPAQSAYGQGKTSGQVASDIEKKFGIVETFANLEEKYIVDNFELAYENGLISGLMGGSWDIDWDATPLEGKFRRSLTSRRFDGIVPGVPTRAAARGVRHSLRNPFAPGRSARPSFVNTGLYMRSFRAWTEP